MEMDSTMLHYITFICMSILIGNLCRYEKNDNKFGSNMNIKKDMKQNKDKCA